MHIAYDSVVFNWLVLHDVTLSNSDECPLRQVFA